MTRAAEIFEAILSNRATEIVLGAALAIGFAMFVEWLRKPNLQINREIPTFENDNTGNTLAKIMRALRVQVTAKPLPRGTRWMLRSPALQCIGTISFHHLDGQNIFGPCPDVGRTVLSPHK